MHWALLEFVCLIDCVLTFYGSCIPAVYVGHCPVFSQSIGGILEVVKTQTTWLLLPLERSTPAKPAVCLSCLMLCLYTSTRYVISHLMLARCVLLTFAHWVLMSTHTGWALKSVALYFCLCFRQLLTDFQNSFAGTLCGQFAITIITYTTTP